MTMKRSIVRADITALADYVKERGDRRRRMAELKRLRRVGEAP